MFVKKNKVSGPKPTGPPILQETELTPAELAAFLKVKEGTVYSWINRGVELPPYLKIGGTIRFRQAAVMEWIIEKEKVRKQKNFEA